MYLTFKHHYRRTDSDQDVPNRITIKVSAGEPGDFDDLERFGLTPKPFLRDLVNGKMITFSQLIRPAGVTIILRPEERFEDFEALAHMELRFVADQLAGKRSEEAWRHRSLPAPSPLTGVL